MSGLELRVHPNDSITTVVPSTGKVGVIKEVNLSIGLIMVIGEQVAQGKVRPKIFQSVTPVVGQKGHVEGLQCLEPCMNSMRIDAPINTWRDKALPGTQTVRVNITAKKEKKLQAPY